ncbi:MAG: glycosyltransferase family 2 protein [Rhodobiaceae bacterium]|nr:glycosyltransferase family 2 protein [Rhodobiaceae bacterium]MCC0018148.1 glycosyltransferase family 2 protein [Rhodobiaceae bacterium]MCC0051286.1 glycosyltransferase family 2 protein [Rhodobiaceae bacterium]
MREIAVVVPFFNEEESLPAFVEETNRVFDALSHKHDVRFRMILVDDGSRDGSVEWLKDSAVFRMPVDLVQLSRNFGKESAISAGLDAANGVDAVVIMDADLQHPPAIVDAFLDHWLRDGFDIVYAHRKGGTFNQPARRMISRLFYKLINSGSRFDIPRDSGDFRLMNRRALTALGQLPERERFMKGLYAWIGFRQKGIAYNPSTRKVGKTKFSVARLFLLSVDGITSFTVAPLRYMSAFGIAVSALSFLYGLYILAERLFWGNEIPGFASIITLIAFFGGMQFICIGIIGEYIGKILIETKRRPKYSVAERVVLSDKAAT